MRDGVDSAGFLQPGPDGEHGKDQNEDAAIDRLPSFLGVDAFQEQDARHRKHGESFDRHDVHGGEHDDGGQGRDGDRGLATPEAARARLGDVDEVGFLGRRRKSLRRTLEEEAVCRPQTHRCEVQARQITMTANAEQSNTEPSETHFIYGPRWHVPACRQHRLDNDVSFVALDGTNAQDLETRFAIEGQNLGHGRDNDDPIVGLENLIGQVLALRPACALQGDEPDAGLVQHLDLTQPSANEARPLRDGQFGQKESFSTLIRELCRTHARGQKNTCQEEHGRRANQGSNDAHRSNLENLESRQSVASCHTVDQEIGRRADQRACSPKNRCVGQRDEQLGRGHPNRPRKANGDGDENGHHGRVVHEGGCNDGAEEKA